MKEEKKMIFDFLIIDNTAFVSGLDLNLIRHVQPNVQIFITPDIYDEASCNPRSMQLIEIAQMQGLLNINEPTRESMDKVEELSEKTGDRGALSRTDKGLIALYLDLKKEWQEKSIYIMSDDYSVQNVCLQAQPIIPILKFTKDGIKEAITWEVYCPSCYKIHDPSDLNGICENCKVRLKRRKKK